MSQFARIVLARSDKSRDGCDHDLGDKVLVRLVSKDTLAWSKESEGR